MRQRRQGAPEEIEMIRCHQKHLTDLVRGASHTRREVANEELRLKLFASELSGRDRNDRTPAVAAPFRFRFDDRVVAYLLEAGGSERPQDRRVADDRTI